MTQTDTPGVTQTVFGVSKALILGFSTAVANFSLFTFPFSLLRGLLHPQFACGAVATSNDVEALLQSGLTHTVR